jgi:signal transduction histidine kinase
LLAESTINDARDPLDPALLTTSSDTALTAFAQLGALRLGAQRCLISLFDSKREHIIAEATGSTTLAAKEECGGHVDDLWLSGTAIPRGFSVSEHVLFSDTSAPYPTHLPVSIVPDLASDPRFDNRPYARNSGLHFYAGVPIRSPRGVNIGVYSVYSTEPRTSIDPPSIRFLQDISRTIMTYLQRKSSDRIFHRNARMVSGLGSLVEGKSSMSRPRLSHASAIDPAATANSLNPTEESIQIRQEKEDEEEEDREQQEQQAKSSAGSERRPTLANLSEPVSNGSVERASVGSESAYRSSSIGNMSLPSLGGTSSATTQSNMDESLVEIQALFSGAAEIIRESIEVDGVLFLDAAVGSYGGLVIDPTMEGRSSDDSQASQASSSDDGKKTTPAERKTITFCKVLGMSVSELADMDPGMASSPHRAVPEDFLKSMLRRYAGGHTFTFDDSGAIQSADSEEDAAAAGLPSANAKQAGDIHSTLKRRQPRRSDGDVLLSICSNARNVALVPLWDSHKERWFAGSFIWTRTPNRVFTRSEVGYLAAFGTAMMANVARIEMMRADRGKTDVLGSLSHELRTPLHGIILGAELLRDTRLNAFQEDVLHTVEMCGRTLVQTMEHLLDFSKINRFTKKSRKRRVTGGGLSHATDRNTSFKAEIVSLVSDISLDSLLEEVIESVYAGYSFQQTASARESGKHRLYSLQSLYSLGEDAPKSHQAGPAVSVYVNIDPNLAWDFRAQPGAIRRVIMNLFGNALKYTSQGTVRVSLTQDRSLETKATRRRAVVFTVSDTGKGMSQDYLRNRLFTPFAQEDQLASGVGLGLSLVKQITKTLKGSIGVDSQLGRGTSVRVMLPLTLSIASPPGTPDPVQTDFSVQVKALEGLGVRLVGFRDVERREDTTSSQSEQHLTPMALMEKICRSWLGLKIISDAEAATASTAFNLCTEEGLEDIRRPKGADQPRIPVIVVCRDAMAAHELAKSHESDPENIYEFVSQP